MSKLAGGALLHSVTIDRDSDVPIYRQLEASLRRLILDGSLAAGQKLPSTRELAQDLGISRITVTNVYDQIIAEGYATARTGSGTFVADGLDTEAFPRIRTPKHQSRTADVEISDRARALTGTKAAARYGKIDPFRPGVPALDHFPAKLWGKYLSEAITQEDRHGMSYGEFKGSLALRHEIARHLRDARGMKVEADRIIITSGAQQAFVLIAFVLLERGDTVWYEDPGHVAGRDVMQFMGANVAPVPIDDEGLDLDHAIRTQPRPSLIFTTPSHQQPLGTTMSLGRRLALLNHAQDASAWIIEDDYDSEFRFRGRPLPALAALDGAERVLYTGTFSKSMFAAMRLGYVVVPTALADSFAQARNLLGQNSSTVVEEAMARFMKDGRFVEHIRKMRKLYRARRDVLMQALATHCPDVLTPETTDAGMHLVAWLRDGVDDEIAHRALLEAGIDSLPLSVYCQTPFARQALVLGFSGVDEADISRLVRRVGEVLRTLPR
ncbi:PLP-dependent aminotransferase family protein [Aliiroseovarius sp. KMU-50]|uniref:PLP-dependent aminotransferase family protein n=1 Tax=Aliiroseovarius salicola TaxID=3009082 RepID=A0ABT4W4B4_9RHOB|nr:PLP-dependent aminotransferase family protein [Aliiroseovarius sp. KMU-50]MDA5095316.1 PLP-dependent aminotransferase family protein [Aliiroseovarius sp. KMU-50]